MRLRLPILIGFICAAAILAFGQDDEDGQGNRALLVPSNQYPTIQSAINAARDRGVIKIAGGIFTEALVIQGKSITLQGSADPQSPTEIRVTDQVSPVVTFGFGGSGSLRSLTLSYGGFGISAPPDQEWLASVDADSLLIHDCGRGVYGRFSTLNLRRTTIDRSLVHGMSIIQADRITLDGLIVSRSGRIGILFYNLVAHTDFIWGILNTTVYSNGGGGIYIVGGATPLQIGNNVLVDNNRIAGITLLNAPNVVIQKTEISNTISDYATGSFGDGIDVYSSTDVTIFNSNIHDNARAGIATFGCGENANSVTLQNDLIQSNAFALDYENLPGCMSPPDTGLIDGGHNTCGTPSSPAVCSALTSGLAPPSSTPPAP
jgi:hypothetical protein